MKCDVVGKKMQVPRARLERWKIAQEAERAFWKRRSRHHDTLEKKRAKINNVHSHYRPTIENLTRELRLSDSISVLEIGSGPTCIGQLISAKYASYIDPLMDFYRVEFRDVLPDGELICQKGEEITKGDDSYDLVFCINSLDHMAAPEAALGEVVRVLRPGGFLVLGLFIHPPVSATPKFVTENLLPFFREDAHPHHFTDASIRKLLAMYPLENINEIRIEKNRHAFLRLFQRHERIMVLRNRK